MFAALFAGAIAFTLIEWIAVALFVVFLVSSITVYSSERYGASFCTMVLMFLAAGFLFHAPLIGYLQAGNLIRNIAEPVGIYLAIGLVVSFVNWVLFCMHAKTRYRNLVLEYLTDSDRMNAYTQRVITVFNDGRKEAVAAEAFTAEFVRQVLQLDIGANQSRSIFGSSYTVRTSFDIHTLSRQDSIASAQEHIAAKMAELFPPRTLKGKAILASAVFEWPITILSTLFSRVLTVIVDKIIYVSRKFIDWVSHISFGSTDIKV